MKIIKKIQQCIKHIKTMFYTKVLAVSLKKKHDTRLLKTMDEYKINFDLDSKIAWNRHRMRELFEMYKKIENYYPIFLGFLGFIGIYYFDFIILLINDFNWWFLATTSLTTISITFVVWFMCKIMFTNKWNHDGQPKLVYKQLFDDVTIEETEKNNGIKPDLQLLDRVTRESYLDGLEEDLAENTTYYSTKKKYVNWILKSILISLLVYSFNIIHYKQLDSMAKKQKERIDEGEDKSKSNKIKTTIEINVIPTFDEFVKKETKDDNK